ncbi:MAG: hypothetical protein ACI4PP_02115 [Clostridia bacterium]
MDQRQRESYHNKAVASMVLGIIGVCCIFFGYSTLIGIVVSVIGLVFGIQVQKEAPEAMAKAGVILSAIALGLCAIVFVACVACAGLIGVAGFLSL